MGRYPKEVCPNCQKNHRKGNSEEMKIQQTFYYEAHLSNQNVPNEYRWKTYRCIDCNIFVMFIEHSEVKNISELNQTIKSITVHLIKQNKNFKFAE